MKADIQACLVNPYTVNGKVVKGQSINFLMGQLRDKGHVIRGNAVDFADEMENLGFGAAEGRNHRNSPCTVVYIK